MEPDSTPQTHELTIDYSRHNILLSFGNGSSRFRPAQLVLIYPMNHSVEIYDDCIVEIERQVKLTGLDGANEHVRKLVMLIARLDRLISASIDPFGGNVQVLGAAVEGTANILASLLRSEYEREEGLICLQP